MNPRQTGVTAIMVTGKTVARYPLALASVDAFLTQDYTGPRELVIINDNKVPLFPDDSKIPGRVREIHAPLMEHETFHTLGALRNLGLRNARMEYIVQWDDDDFSASDRLTKQVRMTRQGAASIFKWELHVNLRTGKGFTNNGSQIRTKGFPGTMLFPTACEVWFPQKGKAEDTEFLLEFAEKSGDLQVIDNDPCDYLRFYHGHNTWDEKHVMGRKRGSRDLNKRERAYVREVIKLKYRKIQENLNVQAG